MTCRVQIDGTHMERLVQIPHKVRQQQQCFFLIFDRERQGRRFVLEHRDDCVNRAHDIMIARSNVLPIVGVVLDRHIREVKGFVAIRWFVLVGAIAPVASDVVDHPLGVCCK